MNPFVKDIMFGKHDADLGAIISTAIRRRKIIANTNTVLLRVHRGRPVRIHDLRFVRDGTVCVSIRRASENIGIDLEQPA